MNAAVLDLGRELNDRPMKHLGASRRELFERLDRPALKPLPQARFEMASWKNCGVNIDYHIDVEHNLYSVPHQLIHQRVDARVTAAIVEVYFKGGRVASHERLFGRGRAGLPRLYEELAVARGDGSYGRLLARLTRTQLLIIDDWGLAPLRDQERRDLLEVVEDRYERASTLITSQLPVKSWHEVIGDATLADASCDRLVHCAHSIVLKGRRCARSKRDAPPRSPHEPRIRGCHGSNPGLWTLPRSRSLCSNCVMMPALCARRAEQHTTARRSAPMSDHLHRYR